jgi:hypothetical protein
VFQSFVKSLHAREQQPFAPLRQLVAPYILRRLKTDRTIIADLPEKTETARYCHLTRPQIKLYEHTVREMAAALASVDSMARRGLVLQTLLRLKQICNRPSQLSGDGAYMPADSGKFLRLAEIGDELAARQEKVLIFTQFREIIDPLAAYLATVFGRTGVVLHGGTSVQKRQALVDHFQSDDGPPFFILSLRAGGTGLNLTAAPHVIHFDRWWNPAVENQATDRDRRALCPANATEETTPHTQACRIDHHTAAGVCRAGPHNRPSHATYQPRPTSCPHGDAPEPLFPTHTAHDAYVDQGDYQHPAQEASHWPIGGPAAPTTGTVRGPIRRPAWGVIGDRVPLGSHTGTAQPTSRSAERLGRVATTGEETSNGLESRSLLTLAPTASLPYSLLS